MSADDDLNSGLLGIGLSLSDSEDSSQETEKPLTRAEKNAQTEEEFQKLRSVYKAKIENGEIWQTIDLPLKETVSKPLGQELLHAVEELYFFRRYSEALDFVGKVLEEEENASRLDNDSRELLGYYQRRCADRMRQ
ncbi:hypothetical protein DL546_005604 [Coniochaeta pulveracea]|uniref:Uncharacterized protein n=1 Tax=Coniochaeta pulveracea TaxID=177199 RepID=A0A420YNF8_9PEZI|nr:hypothetical protein DL546_005604 [Coniochaeta pulveracea]